MSKEVCSYCQKEIRGKVMQVMEDWGTCLACEPCYNKRLSELIEEDRSRHLSLLKLRDVFCVKCGNKMEKFAFEGGDEVKASFCCNKCGFVFLLWHGEPPIETDDYEEKDWKEYADAKKRYEVEVKKWEDRGSPNGQKPVPPRDPEDKAVDEANERKYGEC